MNILQISPFLKALDQSDAKAFIETASVLRSLPAPYKLSKKERFAFGSIMDQVAHLKDKTCFLDTLQDLKQLQDFHPGFLADTLGVILDTKTEEIYKDSFLALLPERIFYLPLLFRLCRLHARLEEKTLLLKYMQTALDLGMAPDEFRNNADFEIFQNDIDFSKQLQTAVPLYIPPLYIDFLWDGHIQNYNQSNRRINTRALRLDYHETQRRFPERIFEMKNLEHLSLVNYSSGLPLPLDFLQSLERLTSISWVPSEWGTPFPTQLLEFRLTALEVPEYVLESIAQLPHVKKLYLHCKTLEQTLRNRYKTLHGVKHLTISALWEHELQIPKEIGELKQLESLCIEGSVSGIPESFSNLRSLKHLRILTDKNDKIFPKVITQLKDLEVLEIIGAPFTEIPASLGQLQKLKRLSLAHSFNEYLYQKSTSRGKIDVPPVALPNCFGNLENLRELDLSYCAVDDISVLSKLKRLQVLHLVGTPVKNITFLREVQIFNQPGQFKRTQNL
ncbi:MAG: leucine-rich repeat domain-containing protein [Bacteroidota bacterium]